MHILRQNYRFVVTFLRNVQGDPSGRFKPPVDLGFRSFGNLWAATYWSYLLPYYPYKTEELSQGLKG